VWRNDRGAIDVAFATDLDDQISARARKAVGDEVARIQADIRAKVNARIAAKRKEVEALYEQKRAEAMRRVNDVETQVKQKLAVVEQKKNELEQRVEQEKKKAEDSLKKKAGDALKGILKRN
jgi:dsDNA-specific endonuclease/ATPase MutS2